jgi:hypothetical protein
VTTLAVFDEIQVDEVFVMRAMIANAQALKIVINSKSQKSMSIFTRFDHIHHFSGNVGTG